MKTHTYSLCSVGILDYWSRVCYLTVFSSSFERIYLNFVVRWRSCIHCNNYTFYGYRSEIVSGYFHKDKFSGNNVLGWDHSLMNLKFSSERRILVAGEIAWIWPTRVYTTPGVLTGLSKNRDNLRVLYLPACSG